LTTTAPFGLSRGGATRSHLRNAVPRASILNLIAIVLIVVVDVGRRSAAAAMF
jgi:hypothetical protein